MNFELKGASDFVIRNSRCAFRLFKRYSIIGSNRVCLTITLFQTQDFLYLSSIVSYNSQAYPLKVNTVGQEVFLNVIQPVIKKYQVV